MSLCTIVSQRAYRKSSCVLLADVLGQIIQNFIQIIDCQASLDDGGSLAHDLVQNCGEVTRAFLGKAQQTCSTNVIQDTNIFFSRLLPVEQADRIWISYAEWDQFDVGLGEVLLLQAIHSTLTIFLLTRSAYPNNF